VALLVGALACAACGAAADPAPAVAPAPDAAREGRPSPPKPLPRTEALAAAKVYDDKGNAAVCGPAGAGCAPLPASSDFLDRCRLAGFRVLQCGCDARCTGDVVLATRHWDAAGQARECAPATRDCTPPQASAAFQDACAEHGYRLDVCGCEWLCSGDFKR
jgi:hypothetical protein